MSQRVGVCMCVCACLNDCIQLSFKVNVFPVTSDGTVA